MIDVKNVSIVRDAKTVLDNFSFTANSGEITALIGANGSGKSSLISAISGDLEISGGVITLGNHELNTLSIGAQSQLRSVVLQKQAFNLAFSVQEIIEMSAPAPADVGEVLSQLHLHEIKQHSVTTLSVGQVQRVAIAAALVRKSSILIADEPFASQDQESIRRIISILKKRASQGDCILVVVHASTADLQWVDKVVQISQ
jgi:iron complex transport system ATP-binding protein